MRPATALPTDERPVSATEWHGWGWTDNRHPDLHIGPYNGRYVLFTEYVNATGSMVASILAVFNSERDARIAMKAIDMLMGHDR